MQLTPISPAKIIRYFLISLPYFFLVFLLYLSKTYSYLLFHASVEIFSVIIAASIFLFAWNAEKIMKNNYFLFLGISYMAVGVIDFVHALAYKGMHIFSGFDANLPTQLWIAGRYLLAISAVIAPLFITKKLNKSITMIIYALITALILLTTMYWKNFPASYVEGLGLTQFKIVSEYFVILLFLAAITLLIRYKNKFDNKVLSLLIISFLLNIVAEICFTLYIGVYDLFNMLGHIAKLFSYLFIYWAIVEIGLAKPYNLMFLELQQLGKRKDEFLNLASHEIKNPVAGIKIYTQLLAKIMEKDSDPKASRILSQINQQTDKVTSLINDLLDLGKIESGKLALNKTEFDLNVLINKVLAEFKYTTTHQIIKKGAAKKKIYGDQTRIEQVLINLFTNAIKYSPDTTEIIIEVREEDKFVIVGVRDFGPGIPKNKQKKIFERFYRIDEKNNNGSGLGLYI